MALTQYKFGQDILIDVLFRCGESTTLTGATSDYLTAAKRYIQRRYHDIIIAAPWPWALKSSPGVLNVVAKQTNTATITKDSASVTLGTAITDSATGYLFEVDAKLIPYRISSHTAGDTALTLDATYKEASVSAGTCTIYKDEYSLSSDCWKVWRAWDRNNPYSRIEIIQPGEMHDIYTSRHVFSSDSYVMSIIRDGVVRLTPIPDTDAITVEYEYTAKVTSDLSFLEDSDDTLVVPDVDRAVISDLATVDLMMDKNDPRADSIASLANIKLMQMLSTYINVGKFRRYVRKGQSIGETY